MVLCSLKKEERKCDSVRVLMLESVNVLRKYSMFLIFVRSNITDAANWSNRKNTKRSMVAHKSKYVWFRRLHVIFSR